MNTISRWRCRLGHTPKGVAMHDNMSTFEEKLKRIYQATHAESESALARILNIKPPSIAAARKRQQIPTGWIEFLAARFGVSADWLFFGKGEMHPGLSRHSAQAGSGTSADCFTSCAVPVIALGACSTTGWHAATNVYLSADPPVISKQMFGVLSVGDSMLPAGICEGQLLYCDPDSKPRKGDAVFVQQHDNSASIKLYMQEDDNNIYLQGWLSPDSNGLQKPYTITLFRHTLKTLATVLYTKRRIF